MGRSGWGAAALGAGIAIFVGSARADERTVTVTVTGGGTVTVPVPVPSGTPVDGVEPPPVQTPLVSVSVSPPPSRRPSEHGAPAGNAPAAAQPAPAKRRRRRMTATAKKVASHVAVPVERSTSRARRRVTTTATHAAAAVPTPANPTFSLALPGPAPIGVPDFFIDKFRIPPFLLPIYQAAGTQYDVRWEVLAAINEIETDYGRNLNVSSAGAMGWMQFMPSTWHRWGVDANGDGVKDPYNPVDAIFTAARYLAAAGADKDLRRAIFAYNHADWYVDSIVMRARLLGGLPADLVGSLTGLTEGRFPVRAPARYADEARRSHRGTDIYARVGSPVVAVQDGKVVGLGRAAGLGSFIRLRDAYGNTYTYAHLEPARTLSPRRPGRIRLVPPDGLATERLFAHPARSPLPPPRTRRSGAARRPLRRGSHVVAGTVLGHVAQAAAGRAAHLLFAIRPGGRGAPLIDPKPMLDGWKLLESTAIYRAAGKNPFFGRDARNPTIGQVLLLSKSALERRVLRDPRVTTYPCGRQDIRAGVIDRRVLATLEFLSASGLEPTVSALRCGHSTYTAAGNVSEHSEGTAVDIAKINGIPILGHQGPGSITDIAIRRLLTLQGAVKPHQIISLMAFPAADNTLALPDHADHIHVGFRPLYGANARLGRELDAALRPGQWTRLIKRLGTIRNPEVLTHASRYATD